MKICFLSDPNYLHTQRWARYFTQRGHEVSIVGSHGTQPLHLQDIRTYLIDDQAMMGPWILRTTRVLNRLLDDIEPDILHMHYLSALVAPAILRFRPFVVSVWGSDIVREDGLAPDRWRERFLKQTVLRHADAILSSSLFLAKATCQYAGLSPERVSVYPWGVDLQRFTRPRSGRGLLNGSSIVIGFVKHLYPQYGPEYLLRAIPSIRARYPALKVILIGDGPLGPDLKGLAEELGIADIVTFCGRVAHDRVPTYLSQMDIFVMPSLSESFGVSAVEAQAMGIPVVATTIGGIPEAVLDGTTGLLVPPRDSKAIAGAVIRLIEADNIRESMAREGPRFVARQYDWEKNAGRVEELYHTLVARHRS